MRVAGFDAPEPRAGLAVRGHPLQPVLLQLLTAGQVRLVMYCSGFTDGTRRLSNERMHYVQLTYAAVFAP